VAPTARAIRCHVGSQGNVAGKCKDDPPHRALDPHRELQQPLAQRGDLRVGTGGARGPAPQVLEQHVRRQGQQHAKLVGQEPLATRSVQLQPVMQLLQPILDSRPRPQ
jgi:hypothetical protein